MLQQGSVPWLGLMARKISQIPLISDYQKRRDNDYMETGCIDELLYDLEFEGTE